MKKPPFNKKTFNSLVAELKDTDTLTIKRKGEILDTIEHRVDEVWRDICDFLCVNLHWWSFSNDVYDGEGNGSDGGEFDPYEYADWIYLIGEWTPSIGVYDEGFPTKFLYTDYLSVVLKTVEKDMQKSIVKKAGLKLAANRCKTKKAILAQLSKLPLEKLEQVLKNSLSESGEK